MSNFSIDTAISLQGFENNISKFNVKAPDKSFEEIFNSMGQTNNLQPIEAGISIDKLDKSAAVENASPTAKMASDIGAGFKNGLNELNSVQRAAETDFETFASGGDISVHDVMISAQKSNLSMQMAIQLRNQMINAYNEFKNMAI